MGAWGTGFFENDDALDWLNDLQSEGKELVATTIKRVADYPASEYLEALPADEPLAAASCRCSF